MNDEFHELTAEILEDKTYSVVDRSLVAVFANNIFGFFNHMKDILKKYEEQ